MIEAFGKYAHGAAAGLGHGMAGIAGGLGLHGLLSRFDSYSGTGLGNFGQLSFYSTDNVRRAVGFSARAFVSGVGLGAGAVKGAFQGLGMFGEDMRRGAVRGRNARDWADAFGSQGGVGHWKDVGQDNVARHVNQWGIQKDGYRRFGARSPGEHLKKGGANLLSPKYGVISPMAVGLNVGTAAFQSDDNIFDPHAGMAKHLATNVGAEVGFVGGGAAGAALAAAMIPGAGLITGAATAVGFLLGGMLGAEAGAGVAESPFSFASFGNKYGRRSVQRKSQFQDSEHAMTMRQRAMQSIRRNQMSARSAFGQEALAYHA